MKFRTIGQAAWAGAVSAGLILGVAACGQDNTLDYLYVASSKNSPGQIDVYLVDGPSGVLTPIKESPYTTGKNPVSVVATPNGRYLYVLNHDDNTIIAYSVNDDAQLTKANTYSTPGSNPTAMKINSTGTFLFVLDAFQPGYSATTPGPGDIVVYPVNTDGSLGTPVANSATGKSYFPTCNNPVDLTVLNNNTNVYVIDDPAGQPPKLAGANAPNDQRSPGSTNIVYSASGACSGDSGQIDVYGIGTGGALTEIAGSPIAAGVTPTAIASTPTDQYVYAVDLVDNQLLAWQTTSNGMLITLNNGPFPTGTYPDAVIVDPRGLYIYVANYNGQGSISAYAINTATGVPSALSGTGAYGVTTGPTSLIVEPNGGKYLYSTDFIDNSVFGTTLNANTGALGSVENSPYPSTGQPTAMAAVVHGPHPTEVVPQY